MNLFSYLALKIMKLRSVMNGEVYVNTSGTYAFGVDVPLFYRLPFWKRFCIIYTRILPLLENPFRLSSSV